MSTEKSAPAAAGPAPASAAPAAKAQEKTAVAEKSDGKAAPAAEAKSTRVFIGNLHFSTTADQLRKHLETVAPVLTAEVISYASGRSKGCGLAEFKNVIDAEKAKALTNSDLGGRKIFIREDREAKGFGRADPKPAGAGGDKPAAAGAGAAAGASNAAPRKEGDAPRGGRGRGRGEGRGRGAGRGRGRGRGRFADAADAPARPSNTDPCNLYVGNLPWATTAEELKQLFSDFGAVLKCTVALDRSGRSKGYATVTFTKSSDAAAAVEGLNDAEVGERKIVVRMDHYAN